MDHLRGSFIIQWLNFNPPGGNVAPLYVHKKQAINIGYIKNINKNLLPTSQSQAGRGPQVTHSSARHSHFDTKFWLFTNPNVHTAREFLSSKSRSRSAASSRSTGPPPRRPEEVCHKIFPNYPELVAPKRPLGSSQDLSVPLKRLVPPTQ